MLEQPEPDTEAPIEKDAVDSPLGDDTDAHLNRANFRRVPNQRGVDEGQMRLYCDTCHNSFIVPEVMKPETCPMGHEPG